MADALSRTPKFHFMTEGEDCMANVYDQVCNHVSSHGYARQDPKMATLFQAAKCEEYRIVVQAIRQGRKWEDLPAEHPARELKEVWNDIAIIDEEDDPLLVIDDKRVVVPKPARREILRLLHLSHVGVTKTRETARERYFWPRLGVMIQQICYMCPACCKTGNNRPREPMREEDVTPISDLRPMQVVGVDLFTLAGKHYFVIVDQYSGFALHKLLCGETTKDTVTALNEFVRGSGGRKS